MDSIINDLASLAKDVNSSDEEYNVAKLIFVFSKELNITPKEFMELEIPLIFDLMKEYNNYVSEQNKFVKRKK